MNLVPRFGLITPLKLFLLSFAGVIAIGVSIRARSFLPSATVCIFAVTLHRSSSLQRKCKPLQTFARKLLIVRSQRLLLLMQMLIVILAIGFISLVEAEEQKQEVKIRPLAQESKDSISPVRNPEFNGANTNKTSNGTRIIIMTSGPAKFSSHWLDNSPKLVVEFQSKNIVSSIGSELSVNEGAIRKITSEYYSGPQKTLKSLTFELLGKVPYEIWQEGNNIILDIQPFLAAPLNNGGKEVSVKDESNKQKSGKAKTSETVLKQPTAVQAQTTSPKSIAKVNPAQQKTVTSIIFWLIGLVLISILGLLAWLFWRRYKLILDKNLAIQEIAKLKTLLQEQNQFIEHEQIIRKAVEDTSLQREKEFCQLKTEFQKTQQTLDEEHKIRKTLEEGLLQKEKEIEKIEGSLESFKKKSLAEKEIAEKLTVTEEEDGLCDIGKSQERRRCSRLDLSKDYNRTIILRIESDDKSKSIKSFANNIGLGGLCFETRYEFKEKEEISIRLFFFGDKVPMMCMQAKVIWRKLDSPVNRYGISFVGLGEENNNTLNRYIESKIAKKELV